MIYNRDMSILSLGSNDNIALHDVVCSLDNFPPRKKAIIWNILGISE
nr:MAG TPA: hypothetical protein [Caudoviricetes sp.]